MQASSTIDFTNILTLTDYVVPDLLSFTRRANVIPPIPLPHTTIPSRRPSGSDCGSKCRDREGLMLDPSNQWNAQEAEAEAEGQQRRSSKRYNRDGNKETLPSFRSPYSLRLSAL
jgi:hypothetical protein